VKPTPELFLDPLSERLANYGAVGAVASPWWLPSVSDLSHWCGDWLPIVGMAWLLIQIGFKAYDRYFRNIKED
jgi:hypothetical protein